MANISNAIITATLAAGSTDAPYYYQVNISQKLCQATCAELTPIFNPVFSVVSTSNVGTGQYVATVNVTGIISYVPCGGSICCTKTQLVSQSFTLPFASANAPTSVSITGGTTVNAIVPSCKGCSRDFVSETPVTLNVA